jgi:hypothetical protein
MSNSWKKAISKDSGAQRFLKMVPSQGIRRTKIFERGAVSKSVSKSFVRLIP